MKDEQSILPCPFCGAIAKIEMAKFGDYPEENYRVECENSHSLDWWETDKNDAIKLWNTRTPKKDLANCVKDLMMLDEVDAIVNKEGVIYEILKRHFG